MAITTLIVQWVRQTTERCGQGRVGDGYRTLAQRGLQPQPRTPEPRRVVGDRPYACRAEKFTAARQTEGYDAIVVAATAKEVKRWRSESVEQTSQPAMRSKCAVRRRPLRHGHTANSVGA